MIGELSVIRDRRAGSVLAKPCPVDNEGIGRQGAHGLVVVRRSRVMDIGDGDVGVQSCQQVLCRLQAGKASVGDGDPFGDVITMPLLRKINGHRQRSAARAKE